MNENPIKVKPYTAGTRCLVIDGSDIRDVEILKKLECVLEIKIPLNECFDLVIGSGSGPYGPILRDLINGHCRSVTAIGDLLQRERVNRYLEESSREGY